MSASEPVAPPAATAHGIEFCALVDVGDYESVVLWLGAHPGFPIDSCCERLVTPLMVSCGNTGSLRITRLLLSRGACVHWASSDLGASPLLAAVAADNVAATALLLAAGANALRADAFGRTPLHVATYAAHALLLRRLLTAVLHRVTAIALEVSLAGAFGSGSGAGVVAAAGTGALAAAVDAATKAGAAADAPLCDVLVMGVALAAAQVVAAAAAGGGGGVQASASSAFTAAAGRAGNGSSPATPIARDALRASVAAVFLRAVNAQDASGYSPLMVAAEHGREENLRILLGAGADVGLRNKLRHTAVEVRE